MGRKIAGVFLLIMALAGFAEAASVEGEMVAACAIMATVFLAAGLLLLFWKVRRFAAEHMAGLPLAESVVCTVSFADSGISIQGGGNTFNLSYDKITAMDVKTNVEIQKSYVSSIGEAVAGAALFGPLGAIVGGRAKEKKSSKIEYFAIFTYLKDGNIDYLSFKLSSPNRARELFQRYKTRIAGQGVVTQL